MEENSSRFRREKVCFLCKVVYSSIIENLFENRSHGRLHCREKDNQITLNEQSFSFCVKGKVRILVCILWQYGRENFIYSMYM